MLISFIIVILFNGSIMKTIEESLGKERGWMDQLGYEFNNHKLEKVVDLLKTLKPHEINIVVRQPDAHHNKKSGKGQ